MIMMLSHCLGCSFWLLFVSSGVLTAAFAIFIFRFVYNAYLSPLSYFPGPFWAAGTNWWKVLISKHGGMIIYLRAMHRETGHMILRIGPNHLSFWDPEAYKEIYINHRFQKDPDFYGGLQVPSNTRSYILTHYDPAIHNPRRKRLFPLFSRSSIVSLELLFHENLSIFISRLTSMAESPQDENKNEVNLYMAFRCLATDVIAKFAFGMSAECLQAEAFEAPSLVEVDKYLEGNYLRLYFTGLVRMLEYLPVLLQPSWQRADAQMKVIGYHILNAYRTERHDAKYPILLSRHLDTDPPLTDDQIISDANIFSGAGGDTIGITLSVGSFYIARHISIQEKLFNELQEAYPNRDDILHAHWEELEKLPYLSACVNESLRMAVPVPGDLPRVVGKNGWEYKGIKIPPGTIVSSSATAVHFNESIFPEPDAFKPERWIGANGLDAWLVSFGKGPRSCLGQTMAMAELHIFLAAFFRMFHVEVVDPKDRLELLDMFTAVPADNIRARLQLRY